MKHYSILFSLINPNDLDFNKVLSSFKICQDKQSQLSKEFFEIHPLYDLEKNSKETNTKLFSDFLQKECEGQGINPIS